jgi:hypothetical protein
VVVLAVTDPDHVVGRDIELFERGDEAGSLGHLGGQDHHRAPV